MDSFIERRRKGNELREMEIREECELKSHSCCSTSLSPSLFLSLPLSGWKVMETIQSQFQEKFLSIFGSFFHSLIFFSFSPIFFLSPLSHLFILSCVDSLPSRFSFFISFYFSYHSKNFLSLFFFLSLLSFSLSLSLEPLGYNRTHDSHAYYQLSFCTFLSVQSDLWHSSFSSLPIFSQFQS